MTIRNKLVAGFGVLVVLLVGVGIFSISQMENLGALTVKMYNHPLTVTRASLKAEVGIMKMHRGMKDVALAKNAADIEAAQRVVAGYEKEVYEQYAIVQDRILGAEGKALIAETIDIFKAWKPIRDEVIRLMAQGDREAAAAITKERGAEHVAVLQRKMDELVNYAATKGTGFFTAAQQTSRNSEIITGLIVALATIGGLLIAYLLGRSIIRPITGLHETITAIEHDADLTRRISLTSKDELAKTGVAFNAMLEKFEAFIQQVGSSTRQLTSAAESMADVARQGSQNMERQRAETDQVAAAMNEMTATVQEVASNTSAAAGSAANADNEAKGGRVVVQETTQAIRDLAAEVERASAVIKQLEQDSESIGTVLDVIRGIAEQTNLLALNAAIEAARAGEQGRGFAVVADEVRTLASRTQKSTQEIHDMIERLQSGARNAVQAMEQGSSQARRGVEQANEAAQSLDAISRAVATINEMNLQIASAAEQQTAVAEEMNRSIMNISQASDETANGARHTASASEQLTALASQLQTLVGQFKIQ